MQLNLNEAKVREMAARLRKTVGPEALPLGKAFEAVSQTLGYPNWDTLSGMLKRETVAKFLLAAPVTLYVVASAVDEFGDGPGWVKVTLDQEFVDKVLSLQALCRQQGLGMAVVSWSPTAWGGRDAESLRISGEDLYVDSTSWWFRGLPKHCDYAVESRMISIELLLKALRDLASDDCLTWAKDVLVYDSSGNTKGLLEDLASDGELDESYVPD